MIRWTPKEWFNRFCKDDLMDDKFVVTVLQDGAEGAVICLRYESLSQGEAESIYHKILADAVSYDRHIYACVTRMSDETLLNAIDMNLKMEDGNGWADKESEG